MYETIVYQLLLSHFTILLFLIYQHLWKSYLSSGIKHTRQEQAESDKEIINEKEDEKIEDIPTHFLAYLKALGSNDFGKELKIELSDESNKNVMFLTNDEISSMNVSQLHKYLLKLLSFEADYVKFKLRLPDKINFCVSKKETVKEVMVEYITDLKCTLEMWDNRKTIDSMENMFSGMLPMITSLTAGVSSNKTDKVTQVDEITELEKEMGMITNS